MLSIFLAGGVVMLFGIVYKNDKVSVVGVAMMVGSIAINSLVQGKFLQ
jgi:hypothetical protein